MRTFFFRSFAPPAPPPPPAFAFLDPGPLVDEELELVVPEDRWIEPHLQACWDPVTTRDMPAAGNVTREQLENFIRQNPGGHHPPDPAYGVLPAYTFWMHLLPGFHPPLAIAGSVSLRLGQTPNLQMYLGHLGYHVFPPARGRRLAERACRLLFPLARAHGFKTLWITTNPDNLPSRRTCERLGAALIDTVQVPRENPLYSQGDREKCRYRVEL